MKKIIFIICLSVLLKPVLPVLEYAVNYDHIAKDLCVNKDKLIMGCNGKCYLIKELAKASESEKPLSSDKKHPAIEKTDLFFDEIAGFDFRLSENAVTETNTFYPGLHSDPQPDTFFRPPAILS